MRFPRFVVSLARSSNLAIVLAALAVGLAGCDGGGQVARRGKSNLAPYGYKAEPQFREASLAELRVPTPEIAEAEYVNDDQLCATCHETYVKTFEHNVHRGQSCEKCHGPASRHLQTRGQEPGTILSFHKLQPPQRAELCLKCHEQDSCAPGTQWRTSKHAHNGVSCTDCHTSHYNVPPGTKPTQLTDGNATSRAQFASYASDQPPPPQESLRIDSRHLGAITPHICYRCHANKAQQEDFAHPHQICGAMGFDCATCHNPHGKIRHETRSELCLNCHDQSSPTMAWHSSIHSMNNVACTDCHNPHPDMNVQQVVDIQHTNIRRPPRMPMSVDQPAVCFKCHGDIYGKTSMPQHHPIKEGKMVCSDCHDAHGQSQGNLREATVNLVCYRCHADKQGPFVYEHPPVTEDCTICHEPHGTVANNLLRQPTVFLCLRCHSGHRTGPNGPNHTALLGDVGTDANLQRSFYTDCTQCHSQIHGSDVPTPHVSHGWMR